MLRSLVLFALISMQQAPDPTLPPPDAHVKVTAVGVGVQVYRCAPQDGGYQWVLEMPIATLFDPTTRQRVGTHSVGPTWTWNDGSSIMGKVLQKHASSDPINVPWLLLETHSTGTAIGILADVTLVRRSDTQAGVPPMACDAVHQNNEVRVPYQATYTFYTTSK
jgi:Protein of unknown function (DUF3455)